MKYKISIALLAAIALPAQHACASSSSSSSSRHYAATVSRSVAASVSPSRSTVRSVPTAPASRTSTVPATKISPVEAVSRGYIPTTPAPVASAPSSSLLRVWNFYNSACSFVTKTVEALRLAAPFGAAVALYPSPSKRTGIRSLLPSPKRAARTAASAACLAYGVYQVAHSQDNQHVETRRHVSDEHRITRAHVDARHADTQAHVTAKHTETQAFVEKQNKTTQRHIAATRAAVIMHTDQKITEMRRKIDSAKRALQARIRVENLATRRQVTTQTAEMNRQLTELGQRINSAREFTAAEVEKMQKQLVAINSQLTERIDQSAQASRTHTTTAVEAATRTMCERMAEHSARIDGLAGTVAQTGNAVARLTTFVTGLPRQFNENMTQGFAKAAQEAQEREDRFLAALRASSTPRFNPNPEQVKTLTYYYKALNTVRAIQRSGLNK